MGIEEASHNRHVATVLFGSSGSLTIPVDEIVARHGSSRHDGPAPWVEMQFPDGLTVMVEELPAHQLHAQTL